MSGSRAAPLKLLAYLRTQTLSDRSTELHLTKLRSEWLHRFIAGGPIDAELLEAFAGFARCCEYIFVQSEEESRLLDRLHESDAGARPIIECYRQLRSERWPIDEIVSFSAIGDTNAVKVGMHYEENPYPRWQTIHPHPPNEHSGEFLVAGCGTGMEALGIAMMSPKASVTAIDLSRASLAFGLAKSREMNVRNVRFLQGDLMNIRNLGQKFDRIWSSGVLHHLSSPVAGLRALGDVLAPAGSINVAIYPRIARAPALAGAVLAKQIGVPPTREGLLWFRQLLLGLPRNHPAHFIYNSVDFYSLSGLRDLCFNPCETVYSVAEAAELVRASGLRLVQFGAGRKPESHFRAMGFTDFSDLTAWQQTENRYPGTFSGMYKMIVAH